MAQYSAQRIGDKYMEIIADVDSEGGYEWDQFVVLRDPSTGYLYTTSGSGCSCNWLYEDVYSIHDLEGPFTLHQAAARAQAWERDTDSGYQRERRRGLGAEVVSALLRMERTQ